MRGKHCAWALILAVSVAACGGSKSTEATTVGTTEKVSAMEAFGLTPPDAPWEQMSFADKEFYMIGKVNPIMKEMFEGHDLEEYGGFDCVDCHGEEMREINFEMPAPSMYVVAPEGTPQHRGMMATFPETVKFMEEQVTPAMGKLLGIDNFTCAGCHPTGESAKAKPKTSPKKKTSSQKKKSGQKSSAKSKKASNSKGGSSKAKGSANKQGTQKKGS